MSNTYRAGFNRTNQTENSNESKQQKMSRRRLTLAAEDRKRSLHESSFAQLSAVNRQVPESKSPLTSRMDDNAEAIRKKVLTKLEQAIHMKQDLRND